MRSRPSSCRYDLGGYCVRSRRLLHAISAMITCDLGAYHMRSRQAVMEAVCVLMGMKPEWGEAKKLLNDMNFLDTLQQYDKDNIEEKRVKG